MTALFDDNDERLTAYALGELDEADRVEVERAISESPQMQNQVAELQLLARQLQCELGIESKPELTAQQRQSLIDQGSEQCHLAVSQAAPVASAAGSRTLPPVEIARRRRIRRWAILGAEIAIAATVAVGIAGYAINPARRNVELIESTPPTKASAARGFTVHAALSEGEDESSRKPDHSAALHVANPVKRDPVSDSNDIDSFHLPGEMNQGLSDLTVNIPQSEKVLEQAPFAATERPLAEQAGQSPERRNRESKFNAPSVAFRFHREQARDNLEFQRARQAENGKPLYDDSKPETSDESYDSIVENTFLTPGQQPLSTFSVDVDSASYSNVRRFLTQGHLPPADAVRIEELINYFNYSYPQPKPGEPFSVTADAAPCPWQREHYLARIALQARSIDKAKRPPTNLVFLLDVSGSMQAANKLPLVKQAMTILAEGLNERDRIAIVTYAGDAGVKLASTPGSDQLRIMQSIEALQAGGSTNGTAGISVAYEEAVRHFNGEGENRVILCTDGDFNVGVSSDEQLVQLIQEQAKSKVFLSIFGFGMGNLKDAKLEKLADKGNGHYGYIDDLKEARRVFNEELMGTLYTVAKDVKIQVEFNPLTVGAYRLIGYENRTLAARDFNDDTKDAGEIGAGHTVTALYEIVPRAQWPKTQAVDPLKYGNQPKPAPAEEALPGNLPAESADDLFTVKLRFKQPLADTSIKTLDYVVDDIAGKKIVASPDFMWAASVAAFGMQLRNSSFKGQWTLDDVHEAAQGAKGDDASGRHREFLDLIQITRRLAPTPPRKRGI